MTQLCHSRVYTWSQHSRDTFISMLIVAFVTGSQKMAVIFHQIVWNTLKYPSLWHRLQTTLFSIHYFKEQVITTQRIAGFLGASTLLFSSTLTIKEWVMRNYPQFRMRLRDHMSLISLSLFVLHLPALGRKCNFAVVFPCLLVLEQSLPM